MSLCVVGYVGGVCGWMEGGAITYQERSLWLLFSFLRDVHKHSACLVHQNMMTSLKNSISDHY